jgi:hypothetical protein
MLVIETGVELRNDQAVAIAVVAVQGGATDNEAIHVGSCWGYAYAARAQITRFSSAMFPTFNWRQAVDLVCVAWLVKAVRLSSYDRVVHQP